MESETDGKRSILDEILCSYIQEVQMESDSGVN